MKKKLIFIGIFFAFTLAVTLLSCKSDSDKNKDNDTNVTDTVSDDGQGTATDTLTDTSSDTVDTTDTSANSEATYYEELAKRLPDITDETALSYIEADGGSVIVAYNSTNAWVFDLKLDSIISIVDYRLMLEAADIGARSGDYFLGDNSLTAAVVSETEHEIRIELTVKSADGLSEYTVYGFYDLDDSGTEPRGEFRGYYYKSISFPSSEKGVTITDISDYEKLSVQKDDYLFSIASAIVNNDISTLAKRLSVEEAVLESWKGMKIEEYTISRYDFDLFLEELSLFVKIKESSVENMPAGNYVISIKEGMNTANLEIISPEQSSESIDSDAAKWLEFYIGSFGWREMSWYNENPEEYVHALLDFMLYKNDFETSGISVYDFKKFCKDCFDCNEVSVTSDYIKNHAGHGGTYRYNKITGVIDSSDMSILTVNYYADPMQTVVAYTHEFTLINNKDGTYKLIKSVRTYDSGFEAYGYDI